jgi:hypothetical protein
MLPFLWLIYRSDRIISRQGTQVRTIEFVEEIDSKRPIQVTLSERYHSGIRTSGYTT